MALVAAFFFMRDLGFRPKTGVSTSAAQTAALRQRVAELETEYLMQRLRSTAASARPATRSRARTIQMQSS